jgi:hypothetical protein
MDLEILSVFTAFAMAVVTALASVAKPNLMPGGCRNGSAVFRMSSLQSR